MMNLSIKPEAQISLENILKQNREEAEELRKAANAKLAENDRIQQEMHNILKSVPPPPASRLVDAFTEGARTVPSSPNPDSVVRLGAEKEVLYAALAIVRSWKRRHKKNYQAQERELVTAVERLTWDK